VPSQGQGLETTLAQIAADELGLTPGEVAVIGGDTLGIGQGVGTFASRAAVVGGTAVALAARDLRAKALRLAAQALGVAEAEVQQDGKVFAERANPEHRIELGRVASVAAMATAAHGVAPGLEATHFFQPPDIAYASGAHVALAEVDPETMHVRLRGYWVSHDSGRLVNPTIVEGQIHGAVALGIGSALLEEVRYDAGGQPLSASYMEYALPRSDDIPPLEIDHLETPSPLNPLGLKGVGESGTLPVAAVVASAVEDALSDRQIRIERMPLTPETLRRLWRPELER
jgi:aerobic carbon-monoxide dehydrogenase large subunit